MSRTLAAKASLAVRVDAFSKNDDESNCKMGVDLKAKVENRLKHLENKSMGDQNKKKFNMKPDTDTLKRKRVGDDNFDNPRKFKN